MAQETKTLVIDNFTGSMTPQINGDINSGKSYWLDVVGYDPFTKPGNLTWQEQPTLIDPASSVITDLIMDGKVRLESGIIYVYAIGHTGNLYKIQVNDPATFNPDYDNPVLLATLSINSPTFTRGGFIDFCGTPQQIFIGSDIGITTIHFDGTAEAFLGIQGSYTQNVPRPLKQFIGKLYAGNGSNIVEVDISGTGTINSYTKLSPGFPTNTQVRDLDLTADGNYMQIVVSSSAIQDLTSTTPSISLVTPSDSYIFKWNGTDTGYTSSTFFPNVVLTSNIVTGNKEFTFGYDLFTNVMFNPVEKLLSSLPDVVGGSTLPNSVLGTGNLIFWGQTLTYRGNMYALFQSYGNLDNSGNYPVGFWTTNLATPTAPQTDCIQTPMMMLVSSLGRGQNTNGYAGGIYTTPKIYYSALETSSAPTTKYRLYKQPLYPTGLGIPVNGAIFQTQNQIFPKKIAVSAVRVYAEPWVAGNIFTVDLIGSNDAIISGGSQTFTAGVNTSGIATAGQCIIGQDYAWYGPDTTNIYSLALRITNLGTTNMVIMKVEIDYEAGGQ